MSGCGEREYSPVQAGAVNRQPARVGPGPRRNVEDRDVLTADPKRQPARARATPRGRDPTSSWLVSDPPADPSRTVGKRSGRTQAARIPRGGPTVARGRATAVPG